MITAIIFFAHLMFITLIFTKKWQTESITSAFMNAALIILLFSVGWATSAMVANLIIGPRGFGLYFDRDTFSLTLLTIAEFFFYKMYYSEKEPASPEEDSEDSTTEDDKETQL